MANVATAKSERTRALILETALCLFQEQGFDRTTMRGIADAAGLSLGAAYYYFKTKDALVLEFYRQGGDQARRDTEVIIESTKDFRTRLRAILLARLEQLSPYRNLVGVLARQAADFGNPLSPFSMESRPIRDEAIGLMDAVVTGSNLAVSKSLRPELPRLLWLMQLGIILYWANDRSAGQQRTVQLIDSAVSLLVPLLRATTLPFMGGIVRSATSLIRVSEACLESGGTEEKA